MITTLKGSACVLGLAGALALVTPSMAAPVLSNTTAVKSAVSDHAIDVRWRGGGWHGGGVAAGVAAGVIAGAAIGAATAPGYYYGPAYGAYAYDAPVVYGGGPYYGPTYGSSAFYNGSYAYPHQTCGVDAGYGRWDYSQC